MASLRIGQLANPIDEFCPFAAVTKWPYRHLHGRDSEVVSDYYFAHGKFRNHGWTIYYINTLFDIKPLYLIPSTEVEALFKEIHKTLKIYCHFPDITRHPGFRIGFQNGPRPRYLGRLTDECSLTDLENIHPESWEEEPEAIEDEDRSFPAFRRKMEAAIQAGKNRQKNAKDKRKRERLTSRKGWCTQLRRAQCYLGLRPRGTVDKDDFHMDPNHSYEESQAAQEAYEKAAGLKLPELITTDPAPYPFDRNVTFVCVDVEAYEKDRNKITEIGISTLDTLDLVSTPPGKGGDEWMKKIRARHFRIAEHGHLRNVDFVGDCADNFNKKFGTSEWISNKEAPQVVASCFRHPFSAPGQYHPYPGEVNDIGRHGAGSQYIPPVDHNQPKRDIVLVGHDIKGDIDYLRSIGYDVSNLSNLLEAIDTSDIFRAMKREQDRRSLGAVLLDLELTGWHLHNAGNDAGYTLEALIGTSIAALNTRHDPAPNIEQLDTAAAEAQARLIEDIEDWEIADEEGGDGGAAVKIPSYEDMIEKRTNDQTMRRANRAEDRQAKDRAWNAAGSSGRNRPSSSLKPTGQGKGEIKFHAANEKTKMEMEENWEPPHPSVKASNTDVAVVDDTEGGGVALPDPKMQARLAALDEMDEYFTI